MHRSSADLFLAAFSDLKSQVRNDPGILWIARENERPGLLACWVVLLHWRVERELITARTKRLSDVPDGFEPALDDYRVAWAERVKSAAEPWWEVFLSKLSGARTGEQSTDEDERPDFDPVTEDAAKAFRRTLEHAEDSADAAHDVGWIDLDDVRKGVQAFEFLEDAVGLDLVGIVRRWKRFPYFQIRRDLLPPRATAQLPYLTSLLDEATRAFVFGAFGAAVAMCRGILETVLRECYPEPGRNQEERIGLDQRIDWAVARYGEPLASLDLHTWRHIANRVLHRGHMPKEDDVVGFLRVLKRLIDNRRPDNEPVDAA